ncbi:MAG: Maf family protein [Steroidobacteraceae bacterium]
MTRFASICLASASPRRGELLRQIGVSYVVQPADLDEAERAGESPAEYVERLARAKAEWVWQARQQARLELLPVLGSDTTVTVDGLVLGKPQDEAALLSTFSRLSGREHEVLSAVALVTASGIQARLSRTRVRFRVITADEARSYWATGEPCDKAGGYAIQGYGAVFIESIAGSYSGVMGLPLAETAELLVAAGVQVWQPEV